MSVTLEIPDDFAARLQSQRVEAEAQLHLELAIALYRRGELPVARAAEIAGLELSGFEHILRERGVTMPYSRADLEHDVAYASGRH
jgi:predicted HTH domain antitoxin